MFKEWNSVAEAWNNHMGEGDWFQRNIIYPEVLRLLTNVSQKSIIDIGCGNGHLCRFLSNNGAKMFGVDSSEQMIKYCESHSTEIEYACIDIAGKIVLNKNDFDIAIFNNSLQDIREYQQAIINAYNLLKERGNLLIIVKHPCFHGRSKECGWRFTTEDNIIQYSGFGLTDLEKYSKRYTADFFLMDNYLEKSEHIREWYGVKTTSYARTLQDYFNTVLQAGFTLRAISEPIPIPLAKAENPSLYSLLVRIPNFIFIYCEK